MWITGHVLMCKWGVFFIQRHNELRDLEAELRGMVCGGELNRGAITAPDVRLDIVARGFWKRQRSAFFDVRVCRMQTPIGIRI